MNVLKSYLHEFLSGPEVRGTRPVLVTFENFKDRDEVLRKELFKYLQKTTTFVIVFGTVRYKKALQTFQISPKNNDIRNRIWNSPL